MTSPREGTPSRYGHGYGYGEVRVCSFFCAVLCVPSSGWWEDADLSAFLCEVVLACCAGYVLMISVCSTKVAGCSCRKSLLLWRGSYHLRT